MSITRNITDRTSTEEALRNNENQLRLITDSIPLLISYVDRNHRYRFVNRNYSEWFGKPREEIIGKHLSEILGEAAYQMILPEVEKALAGEEVIFERLVPYKSGERFIHVNYVPDFDQTTRQVRGFNAFVQDISERKRADEALRKSEEWLRSIFEASRDGILVEDDEQIVYVNKSYTHLFGYHSPEELIGKHISVVISPDSLERMLDYGRKRAQGEQPATVYEFKGKKKDGTLIDVEASVTTSIVGGRPYITTMVRDIAERKQAEKALLESKELLQGTIDALTSNIAVLDKNGTIIKVNGAWREFADQNSFTGSNYGIGLSYLKACFPKEKADSDPDRIFGRKAIEGIVDVIKGKKSLFELEYPCNSPTEIRWFLMRVTSFGSGENLRVVVAHENITDRKLALLEREQVAEQLRRSHEELEQRVRERTVELKKANENLQAEIIERRQSEKERIRILQQLVTIQEDERRRIARDLHDQLGQQLTVLRLKLEILKKMCAGDEDLSEQVGEIQNLARLIDWDVDFLAWQMRPTTLDDLGIVAALDQFVQQWSKHFNIEAEFHANRLGTVNLTSEAETHFYRIAQEALNNIFKHARASRVNISLEPRANDTVLIIEDNGIGFEPENKIFKKKGTKGKGLYGMRERAALIGGTLEIESARGKGTTVYVTVPVSSREKKENE